MFYRKFEGNFTLKVLRRFVGRKVFLRVISYSFSGKAELKPDKRSAVKRAPRDRQFQRDLIIRATEAASVLVTVCPPRGTVRQVRALRHRGRDLGLELVRE